jgi:hypothetical protein
LAKQPGNLNDLTGAGAQEWNTLVAARHQTAIQSSGTRHFVVQNSSMTQPPIAVDWDGIPIRVQTCLKSRSKAMRLSDWTAGNGDRGRAICHEEYMEWRTVRNGAGKITRVEITTEVQEYWITMARHNPTRLLSLVARFAGEQSVPFQQVYGSVNPDAPGVTPADREAGFRSMMLPEDDTNPPRSPYNNGQKAISFLYQGVNTLGAAITLAAFAGFPHAAAVGNTGQLRPLTGSEAIASTRQAAVDCRNSDPTIVGAVIGQAFNGKQVALNDPAGLYITNVDFGRLRRPGPQSPAPEPVPEEWFNLQRGSASADGKQRFQRLVFEVPAGLPFVVGDLIDSQTNETINFGWQVAQLVKVGLYVSVGADVPGSSPKAVALRDAQKCADRPDCSVFSNAFKEMEPPAPPVAFAAESEDESSRLPSRIPGGFNE